MSEYYQLIFSVPVKQANKVRLAVGRAGAGRVGKYTYCSFSVKGTGRFVPSRGAVPSIGRIGKPAKVLEEQVFTVCEKKNLKKVVAALKKAHPYETPVYAVFKLATVP